MVQIDKFLSITVMLMLLSSLNSLLTHTPEQETFYLSRVSQGRIAEVIMLTEKEENWPKKA